MRFRSSRRARFAGGGVVTLALVYGASVFLSAQSLGTGTVSPATVQVNTPTQVTIAILISATTYINGSANLLRVNQSGRAIANLGRLRDDGLQGDAHANDRIYSIRVSLNEQQVAQVLFKVSAAFRGVLRRSMSDTLLVTALAPGQLPPDPGQLGKVTLEGIDADGDGVRDDVQRWIATSFPEQDTRFALRDAAVATQNFLTASNDDALRAATVAELVATRCLAGLHGASVAYDLVNSLDDQMLNTTIRKSTYLNREDNQVPDEWLDFPTLTPLRSHCSF